MTAPAVVAWAVRLGWLHLSDSPLAFVGSNLVVAIVSLFAIGELIADKLPQIPRRTMLGPLVLRILVGGFCGACVCASARQSMVTGAILGAIGGVIGAFAGYEIRRTLVSKLHVHDVVIAIPEDLIAIGLALFLVSR